MHLKLRKAFSTLYRRHSQLIAKYSVTWRYVFGLACRGSTIGFHLLWHTVELAMNTRLCLI